MSLLYMENGKIVKNTLENYSQPVDLTSKDIRNPDKLLCGWLNEAIRKYKSEGIESDALAFVLSTISSNGVNSRVVSLKCLDLVNDVNLQIYGNLGGKKFHEIQENPNVACCFNWPGFSKNATPARQIRIKGRAKRLERRIEQDYYNSLPENVQRREWNAPKMSQEIELDEDYSLPFTPNTVPSFWGGMVITIHEIEFWQGASKGSHHSVIRREFLKGQDWTNHYLAP